MTEFYLKSRRSIVQLQRRPMGRNTYQTRNVPYSRTMSDYSNSDLVKQQHKALTPEKSSPRDKRLQSVGTSSQREQNEEMSSDYDEEDEFGDTDDDDEVNQNSLKYITESARVFTHEQDNQYNEQMYKKKAEMRSSSNQQYSLTQLAGIIVGVCVIVTGFNFFNSTADADNVVISNITDLIKKYSSQPNETFESVETIINDILMIEPPYPAIFLLLYNNSSLANDLVHDLAKFASKMLEVNEDYIQMNDQEFHREESRSDYGYLINKYKPELQEKQVMVVKDLQNIPAQVAQAFHTFCDQDSPLVERAVYFFTMRVDSLRGKEETIVESSLKEIWRDLNSDKLMPLITRISGTVIKIL